MEIKLLPIHTVEALSVVEAEKDIPFPIKRVYYIHGEKKGTHRGFHAHKALRQLLVCMYGSIEIILDDGEERVSVLLDSPEQGLIIDSFVWREMIWNEDGSVLCVLASEYYDEGDYIRLYDEFVSSRQKII